MKQELLYEGITGIRDDLIVEAGTHVFHRAGLGWKKWSALAAALLLVVGLGLFALLRLPGAGSAAPESDGMGPASSAETPGESGGFGTGQSYMSYAGPVFPLTTLGGAEALTAARHIDFDFSPYAAVTDAGYDNAVLVTDRYTLNNPTDEDVTVTALYPFAGSFFDDADILPVLTADGAAVTAELYAGPYSGSFRGTGGEEDGTRWNLVQPSSWEDYAALIEGGYLAEALDAYPVLEQPVVVYELSTLSAPADSGAVNPTLNLEFSLDYTRSTVLTYGFNGGSEDEETGYGARCVSVRAASRADYGGGRCWLVVLGDDLNDLTLRGYADGSCEASKALDGVTATVTRTETTLGEILRTILATDLRVYDNVYGGGSVADAASEALLLGAVTELLCDYGPLSDTPAERYAYGRLDEVFSESRTMERVLYLRFELTIPAGGSVSLSAAMTKYASFDFIGENQGRDSYELATRLGSNLNFTAQTASLSTFDAVELVDQNFGFDPANGLTEVPLDPAVERYWLTVRAKGILK